MSIPQLSIGRCPPTITRGIAVLLSDEEAEESPSVNK
jgi:hypothetical protein